MNHPANAGLLTSVSSWNAELSLRFSKTTRGSVLKSCQHRGPLYVQKPFYPEGRDLAHVYLLHPPGGMVSGDDLQINVSTDTGAQTLVTTPGAGRVYRARPDKSCQRQRICLRLAPESTLEWLPLENIIYNGAYTALNTDVYLSVGSRFIGWEISCLGLRARNETFDEGELDQRLQIFRDDRLLLREALRLNPQQDRLLQSRAGLNQHSVNALLVAGPFSDSDAIVQLQQQLREQTDNVDALAAVSLNGEFLQIRYLGDCSEQARLLFTRCWLLLRPELLQRPGCEPRIWAT